MKQYILDLLNLTKIRITFFVAFSTSAGFIMGGGTNYADMVFLIIGVFLLACGSAILNQLQEWKLDKVMNRTKSRPIPSGRISKSHALILSILFVGFGEMILFQVSGWATFNLGIIALLWYNAIYTPMKKITSLAVVPGALIGAISPWIGWAGTGSDVFSLTMISLGFFFFIWQIPHFWLLLLIYDKDYEEAGFPTLTQKFSHRQLKRVTFVWIMALAVSCMLIPLFVTANHTITIPILFLAGFGLIWQALPLLNQYFEGNKAIKLTFMYVNVYVMLVTIILSVDKLIII